MLSTSNSPYRVEAVESGVARMLIVVGEFLDIGAASVAVNLPLFCKFCLFAVNSGEYKIITNSMGIYR